LRNKYLVRARISEADFRSVLRLWAADVPALSASKIAMVNKNTTHRLYSLLRQRVVMLAEAEAAPFRQGTIEIDESYFGPRRVRGQRGRGAARKIPVIGLLKREGKVFTQIVPDCSSIERLSVIRGQVRRPSVIHTDGWKAYDGLVLDGFRHHRVHHSANEFARGRRHINGIESFWSYAKTRLAKQRGIRLAKVYEHLKETEWRWNHRRENLYKFLLNETRRLPLS
jgi:transposase